MKKQLIPIFIVFLLILLTACNSKDISQQAEKQPETGSGEYTEIGSGASLVKFPENLEEGIVFTTYDRGSIHEDIYINSKEAIEAVQSGEELPSGTIITLVGYKDGELEQYLVMEKRTGWGSQYSPEERNGEWEYQHFNPDREVAEDNIGRCFACHANLERDQYLNSFNDLKEYDLETISESQGSSISTPIASIPVEDWNVTEISAHLTDTMKLSYEESRSIEKEEKAGLIQDILLTMYLNQYIK